MSKEENKKTPEENYKLLKKSFILYTLTAIVTPLIAIILAITDSHPEGIKNLIFLVILTEIYTISRALFDYEEKKEMEKTLFQKAITTEASNINP